MSVLRGMRCLLRPAAALKCTDVGDAAAAALMVFLLPPTLLLLLSPSTPRAVAPEHRPCRVVINTHYARQSAAANAGSPEHSHSNRSVQLYTTTTAWKFVMAVLLELRLQLLWGRREQRDGHRRVHGGCSAWWV